VLWASASCCSARRPGARRDRQEAVHMMKKEELDKVSKVDELWIDVGAADRAEALGRVHSRPGVSTARALDFPNGRLVSAPSTTASARTSSPKPCGCSPRTAPSTRRCSQWRRCRKRSRGPEVRAHQRGGLAAGALVVDVTHATDWPARQEAGGRAQARRRPGALARLGGAPVVFRMLVESRGGKNPLHLEAAPRGTSTDADASQRPGRHPTGLVSVPSRYMHSPNEMVALTDLERAARVLAAFARRLTPNTSFIPE